jgi:hypothetical protein
MNYEFEGFAQQGWQCPICKRVYSPATPMCWYCGNGVPTTTTTTTIEIGQNEKYPSTDTDWMKNIPKIISEDK